MKFFEKKQPVKKIVMPDGKFASDSFLCDKDGSHRMILKIMGDSTYCRIPGCSGTMRRVK